MRPTRPGREGEEEIREKTLKEMEGVGIIVLNDRNIKSGFMALVFQFVKKVLYWGICCMYVRT